MKSFSLIKTNPILTSNMKVVVDSDYNLYMESFNSVPSLDIDRLKKVQFKSSDKFDQLHASFFNGIPKESIYANRYDDDNQIQFKDYAKQYDDIYIHGCSYIDDVSYEEEFECLAPLHIDYKKLPESFVIFRVDGPGLMNLTKDNFKDEVLEKFKTIKVFDLSNTNQLGEWLENSFKDNRTFPKAPLTVDVRTGEFSSWNGIDINAGGYTEKSLFIDDLLEKDVPYYDFDKTITNGFQTNNLVYPNIINFKFLFNDTPANDKELRKWSINRYYGFYVDKKDNVVNISSYEPRKLHPDTVILDNNILYSISNPSDPFVKKWKENSSFIEYQGQFYYVKSTDNGFKIIAPYNLSGLENNINKNIVTISDDNIIEYNTDYNADTFSIDGFDSADVWIININGIYHNITLNDNGDYVIITDYKFNTISNKLTYFVNESDPNYTTTIDLNNTSEDNPPLTFPIFKLNFTDIKEFDTNIVNSDWTRIEYELENKLTTTDEPKMYAKNLESGTIPLEFDQFIIDNELVNIPTSSEYVATQEIFEITNYSDSSIDNLTSLWRKNKDFVKWGFQESLNNYDYPYRFNNSLFSDDMNRSTNVYLDKPSRVERNLDHFYTINPDNNNYIDYTLHLTGYMQDMNNNYLINDNYNFSLAKYLNTDFNVCVDCGDKEYELYDKGNGGEFILGGNEIYTWSWSIVDENSNNIDSSDDVIVSITNNSENDIIILSPGETFLSPGETMELPISNDEDDIHQMIIASFNNNAYDYSINFINTSNFDVCFLKPEGYPQTVQFTDLITVDVPGGISVPSVRYNSDYFCTFFNTKERLNNNKIIRNVKKYSRFLEGYGSITNETVFRGLKFKLYELDTVRTSNDYFGNINVKSLSLNSTNKFEDWKFSILFNEQSHEIDNPNFRINPNSATISSDFEWKIIDNYTIGNEYNVDDLVLYNDVIYEALVDHISDEPYERPGNNAYWTILNEDNAYWNPGVTYSDDDWVYNSNEYYYYDNSIISSNDFWNPGVTYSINDKVIYRNNMYESNINDNNTLPSSNNWNKIGYESKWTKVKLWINSQIYNTNDYVVYNNTLYKSSTDNNFNNNPLSSSSWIYIYSFTANTDLVYGNTKSENNIFDFNDKLYKCIQNPKNETLDNGIDIFINKKWKNVLVNYYCNDNTFFDYTANTNRDQLYNEMFTKLTANNLIDSLSNIDNLNGFSDNINYYIIEEDGYTFAKYNLSNLHDLPYLLLAEDPENYQIYYDSLNQVPVSLNQNIYKADNTIIDGQIDNPSQIDYYYNGKNLGVGYKNVIIKDGVNIQDKRIMDKLPFYKFNGNYMPIFKNIDMFKTSGICDIYGCGDNYIFDTELSNFGMISERIISKVNLEKDVLQFKNKTDVDSIYPMIDEFGYTYIKQFIFKSSWDFKYYVKCE